MKGFGLPGATLICAFAFSLATPALAGGFGFAGGAHSMRAPGFAHTPHTLSPSHHDEHRGRTELGLGLPVYGDTDSEAAAAPAPIPAPAVAPPFFFLPPGYAAPPPVVESHGPHIIYIGHDEAPPSPTAGPKIIYGDEQAPAVSGVTLIRGDQ